MSVQIHRPILAAAICAAAVLVTTSAVRAQDTAREVLNEAFYEHLDEADDAVDALLRWRHALVNVAADDPKVPTRPKTTAIAVSRSEVQELSKLIDAVVATLPSPSPTAVRAPGDLRAHAEQAQRIAQELLSGSTPRPVGTSGATGGTVTIDRTALERLELEIDAMEEVAPRQLKQ